MRLTQKSATLLALAVLIALAPVFFPSGFYYRVGALIFVNGLAVTGIVILTGWAGQISLGHAGFAGIGAYACALAPVHLGLHPALAILLGAALSALVAWLVGHSLMRMLRRKGAAAASMATEQSWRWVRTSTKGSRPDARIFDRVVTLSTP